MSTIKRREPKGPVRLRFAARFRYRPVPPYDFELTARKPAGWSWSTPCEAWEKGTLWSGFWFPVDAGGKKRKLPLGVKARAAGKGVLVDLYAPVKLPPAALRRLRDFLGKSFGVGEDLRPLYRLMRRHRMLAPLTRRLRGMHEGWGLDIFSSLTLAVLLQMAPIKRSRDMGDCLIAGYGTEVRFDGRAVRLWPSEETVAGLSPAELARKCRLGYRANFLSRLARQLARGFPGIEELAAISPEEAEGKLMELYGVGRYSAGFASPHPGFTLDSWSIRIFHPILFGRAAPSEDPRSAIGRASRAAAKAWGEWRGAILVYVLNDLPYLSKKFGIPTE